MTTGIAPPLPSARSRERTQARDALSRWESEGGRVEEDWVLPFGSPLIEGVLLVGDDEQAPWSAMDVYQQLPLLASAGDAEGATLN